LISYRKNVNNKTVTKYFIISKTRKSVELSLG